MRWLARAFAASVLLGAVSGVLVAWALAAWLPHRTLTKRYNVVLSATSGGNGFVSVFEIRGTGMIRRGWGPGLQARPAFWGELADSATIALKFKSADQDRSWGALPAALESTRRLTAGVRVEDARGWPFLALWCSLDEAAIQGVGGGDPAPGGIRLSRPGPKATPGHFRALPMRPIWSGLARNTAVYAGAWLAVLLVLRLGQRILRRIRGRCLACGYDVRGLACCPECGRPRSGPAPVSSADGLVARG